jgi:two-component system response regulator (stage 0 sporulation protein F)
MVGGCVLIVDDDAMLRATLGKVLAKEGYTVFQSRDGHEAERILAEHPVDVMLVDYMMPNRDGLSVARDAMKRAPGLRVIMITAFGDARVEEEASRLGIFAYASKPIRRHDLLPLVRRAIDARP